jgi:Tol biopolymer transport system component
MLKSAIGGITPLGITRSGSFYYGVGGSAHNVYVVKLDPKTGEVKEPPTKLVKRTEGFNNSPQYSPDGKYLAYISASRARIAAGSGSDNTLCIQSLQTGEEREYQREMTRLGVRWFSRPRWSPDGQSMLLYGRDFRDRYGLYLINIREDKVVRILRQQEEDLFVDNAEGWRDAENFFYAIADKKNNRAQIIQRDIDSGNEKIIYQVSLSKAPKGAFSVSRDGQWLSTLDRLKSGVTVLSVISAATGSVRQQTRLGQQEGPNQVRHTWSADGKYIYCTKRIDKEVGFKSELWRIPVDGGQPQKTGLEISGRLDYISAHPDGEHLAYQGGAPMSESPAEVWVMENFLTQSR